MSKLILSITLLFIFVLNCQSANDLTLPAHSFSPTSYFHVYYEFTPAGSITFAIQFNKPHQYFSIGLGSSMTGSDIWVFQVINGKIVAGDYHGIGDTTPALDSKNGGKNDLKILGTKVTSTSSFVKFSRALNTGDSKNDKVIKKGKTSFIWATESGSPTLGYHGPSRGSLSVNLV